MNFLWLVWAAVSSLSLALSRTASADEGPPKSAPKTGYSATLLGGYGAGEKFEDDDRNNYGLALGARAGLTLPAPRLYLGLSFVHYRGYETWQEVHTNTLDGEVGYEFQFLRARLLIRPQLALGAVLGQRIQPDNAGGRLHFHWAPGVLVGVRVAPVLLTAEFRRDMTPSDWPSSNTVLFGAGLRF